MAEFNDYIAQAKSNLAFLNHVDSNIPDFWDWKVTTVFYTAVHLMNAHLKRTLGYTYRTHKEVEFALNFANTTSLGKVDQNTYVAYSSLSKLSRRSRYIVHEKDPSVSSACLTYDRHFIKAIGHLNTLLEFMEDEHRVTCRSVGLDCIELRSRGLKYFHYEKHSASA